MAFILTIHDRAGNDLNIGDLVKVISSDRNIQFYSEVKFLEKEQVIAPFHTFCFHAFEKIDKLPEGLVLSTEERYKVWYNPEPIEDDDFNVHSRYLTEWRECEHLLKERIFRIYGVKQLELF